MEKEIIWTSIALKDFWDIVFYLEQNWQESVLENFRHRLELKIQLPAKATSCWI